MTKAIIKSLLLVFMLTTWNIGVSQVTLVLAKENKAKRFRYHADNNITVQTIDGLVFSGKIKHIHSIEITIDTVIVPIDNIHYIIRHKRLLSLFSKAIGGGGLLYGVTDIISSARYGVKPIIDIRVQTIAIGLISTSLVLDKLSTRRFNLKKKKWKLLFV